MTDFTIPQDAGQRTAMVKGQMERLKGKAWLLIWVDDWSVWPSGRWHHVFTRLRLSCGCVAPLIEKPAHLVEAAEHEAAVSVAVYSVLMLWGCYVISDGGLMLF